MIKKVGIAAGLLLCVFAAWIYSEKKAGEAARPPAGVTTLAAFLDARPQVSLIRRFHHDGKLHVKVIGKTYGSPLCLPSSPPAYVFDEQGHLVDWVQDSGDAPGFVDKWGGFSNATVITAEEARQLMETDQR